MSKFTDYIDGFADKTSTLIISAKKDESEFVRLQAENIERCHHACSRRVDSCRF
jgi:hypothetical protein